MKLIEAESVSSERISSHGNKSRCRYKHRPGRTEAILPCDRPGSSRGLVLGSSRIHHCLSESVFDRQARLERFCRSMASNFPPLRPLPQASESFKIVALVNQHLTWMPYRTLCISEIQKRGTHFSVWLNQQRPHTSAIATSRRQRAEQYTFCD